MAEREPMRFTMRHILIGVAWLALVLAAFGMTGASYATTLGMLGAMVAYFVNRMIVQWRSVSSRERTLLAIALIAAVLGTSVGFAFMTRDYREFVAESSELQASIHEDPRFDNVTARYSGTVTWRVLTLTGSVSSQQDLRALESRAANQFWGFKTHVRWNVDVVPRVVQGR